VLTLHPQAAGARSAHERLYVGPIDALFALDPDALANFGHERIDIYGLLLPHVVGTVPGRPATYLLMPHRMPRAWSGAPTRANRTHHPTPERSASARARSTASVNGPLELTCGSSSWRSVPRS